MSNQNDNAPEMPEPTPVFDVTYSHIYMGQVHNQFYFFLWISLAFFLGAILPWNGAYGDEGFTIWQMIMTVASVGAFWSAMASIKSRRLTLWPVLTLEILAILFVLVHYRDVEATSGELKMHHRAAIMAEIEGIPANMNDSAKYDYKRFLEARYDSLDDVYPLTMGKVFGAPVSGLLLESDTEKANKDGQEQPTRFMAHTAWNSFGSGFHMTWISMLALTLFMLFSFVTAFKNAKPKEDPAEARRKAREARNAGAKKDDDKEIVGEQDDTKV